MNKPVSTWVRARAQFQELMIGMPHPPDAPDWFAKAIAAETTSHFVDVEGCRIHYLLWTGNRARAAQSGILFVHGGGAHANWWRFIAPFFVPDFHVAAIDMSGMGDSGPRGDYSAAIRAREMRAVIEHGDLGPRPFVVGHSFGGFMTMKFGADYGERIGGAVIVDSPIREPVEETTRKPTSRPWSANRIYRSKQAALDRFRLMPEQPCENDFIVDFIARRSIKEVEGGWTWKFDPPTMGRRRFGEPFHEYLEAVSCRAALIYGAESRLVSRKTARYMSGLMGPKAPIVAIPQARHHVMLDQPLAFVAALRMLLEMWRAE